MCPEALFLLSYCYQCGVVVKKDEKKADELRKKYVDVIFAQPFEKITSRMKKKKDTKGEHKDD